MKTLLFGLLFSMAVMAQDAFQDHLNRGKELAAKNQWVAARKEFGAARGEAYDEKQNAIAAWRIAQTYRGEGNIDAALDWYKQSLHYYSSKQAEDEMMQLELQRVGKPLSAPEIKAALTLPAADRSPVAEENHVDLPQVLFDFNKATLQDGGRAQVHQLALALGSDELKKKKFIITGHTDLVGTADYNMALSIKRAQTVCSVIVAEAPVSAGQLKCEGKGMTSPKYHGNSEDVNRLNRRVEVTVLD